MSEQQQTLNPIKKVSKSFLAWYGVGAMPIGFSFIVSVYILYYYDQVLHVPIAKITLSLMVASIFDAITDPIVGAISDRTHSRLGRRHPYLLASAIPFGILFYLAWAPPSNLDENGLAIWLIMCLIGQRLFSTFYLVPFYALGAEITQDYNERTLVTSVRSYISNIGRSIAGATLLLYFLRDTELFPDGKNNPNGYVDFALTFGIVSAICMVLGAWFTRNEGKALSSPPKDKLTLSKAMMAPFNDIKEALQYKSFRSLTAAVLLQYVAFGVAETLAMYMISYFWNISQDMLFWWGAAMFTGLFIGFRFWRVISERIEKKTIYIIGTVSYIIAFTVPYILKVVGFWPSQENPMYLILYVGITGAVAHFFLAGPIIMTGSMLADISDLDELKVGKRREGVIVGAESLAHKMFNSLGPPIAGLVVTIAGLEASGSGPVNITQKAINTLGLGQGLVVAVLFILSLFFLKQYDLNAERHKDIMDELKVRRKEQPKE